MKPKLSFILHFLAIIILTSSSSKSEPLKTSASVEFMAKSPKLEVEEYFSMSTVPAHLRSKEWYVFLSVELEGSIINEEYFYTFQTISKETGIESNVKVKCERTGNHYSDCFLAGR